jgi:hypothetical protein
VPLVAASISTDQLLGGPGSRPAGVDALAARTLVKGEPLAPPAGRADDYTWPRREVGREQAKGDTPVAATTPDGNVVNPNAPNAAGVIAPPKLAPKKPPVQQPAQAAPSLRDFFGFGAPRQPAPPPRSNPAIPRPPGSVGRSAEVPGAFTRW